MSHKVIGCISTHTHTNESRNPSPTTRKWVCVCFSGCRRIPSKLQDVEEHSTVSRDIRLLNITFGSDHFAFEMVVVVVRGKTKRASAPRKVYQSLTTGYTTYIFITNFRSARLVGREGFLIYKQVNPYSTQTRHVEVFKSFFSGREWEDFLLSSGVVVVSNRFPRKTNSWCWNLFLFLSRLSSSSSSRSFWKKLKSYFMSDKQPPKYPNRHDSGIPTNELVIPFPATTITTTTIQNRIWIERALKSWKKNQIQKKRSGRSKVSNTRLSPAFISLQKRRARKSWKDPPFSQFNLNFFDVRRSATMINSWFFLCAVLYTVTWSKEKSYTEIVCPPGLYK